MKNNRFKKTLKIFVAFVLCFVLSSSTVFAAENGETTVYLPNVGNVDFYYGMSFTQGNNGNNCGPTTAANILSYYKMANGLNLYSSMTQELYDQICVDCSYSSTGSGTTYTSVKNGIIKFANRAGYSCNVNKYLLNLFSDVKRDINQGYPIILLHGNHMEVIIGYSEGGSDGNMVYVATGLTTGMFEWKKFDAVIGSVTLASVNIY